MLSPVPENHKSTFSLYRTAWSGNWNVENTIPPEHGVGAGNHHWGFCLSLHFPGEVFMCNGCCNGGLSPKVTPAPPRKPGAQRWRSVAIPHQHGRLEYDGLPDGKLATQSCHLPLQQFQGMHAWGTDQAFEKSKPSPDPAHHSLPFFIIHYLFF